MQCQTFTLRLGSAKDLEALNRFLGQVMPIQVASSLVPGDSPFWSVLVFYEGQPEPAPKPERKATTPRPARPEAPAGEGGPAFEALRKWRAQQARQEGVPPYVVATNAELQAILDSNPQSAEELNRVKGFGKGKIEKYGRQILQLLGQLRA